MLWYGGRVSLKRASLVALVAALWAVLTTSARPVAAQPAEPHPGEAIDIYLLTISPGDHPFAKFGHNSLWVHDGARNKDRVYNYGTYDFAAPGVVPKFFLGRSEYELSRRSLAKELRMFRAENRRMEAQRLNLTPAQRWELYQFLRWNHRKENRFYRYHYYRDNCSTRIRDAIDKVAGGRLRQAAGSPATMTYRQQVARRRADLLPEYAMLYLVAGGLADQPITVWEETFIPMELQKLLDRATVLGPDGGEQPLVAEQKVLLEANRPPPRDRPPNWLGYFLLVGVVLGGGMAALGRWGRRRRAPRVAAAVALALAGLVLGVLGTMLVLIWAFTDHDAMWANENILQCAPWLLAMPVLAVGVGRGRARATRRAGRLWALAAAAGCLGLVLKALPWFDQDNGLVIAAVLPLVLGAAAATRWLEPISKTLPSAR